MVKRVTQKAAERGYLDGQFLIAMPGMQDSRFSRTVVYICAHSADGAMGIMGNGTFSNMMAYSDADWQRIREQIQSTNASDRAKRS